MILLSYNILLNEFNGQLLYKLSKICTIGIIPFNNTF